MVENLHKFVSHYPSYWTWNDEFFLKPNKSSKNNLVEEKITKGKMVENMVNKEKEK
jgi:hypothetical protein